jgi:hypothetical protein
MDFNVRVPFDVRSAISCGYNHVAVVTLEGKVGWEQLSPMHCARRTRI